MSRTDVRSDVKVKNSKSPLNVTATNSCLKKGIESSSSVSSSADNNLNRDEGYSKRTLEWINLSFSVSDHQRKLKILKSSFRRLFEDPEKQVKPRELRKDLRQSESGSDFFGRKKILCNLNGYVDSCSLMAILGPSGSGKSTLLNCLFGCSRTKGIIQGDIFRHDNQDSICFIAQEDHLFDRLTVRETITFALTVRSESRLSLSDIESKVNLVMSQLWLEVCADTFVHSCSGGQRKRISIACELICSPRVMILDEPTSGLDSSTALHCIQLLKNLTTQEKMSILLTIHQPSARVLDSFDNIYFLSKFGHNIYFGPPSELVSYLNSHNLTCPKFHNPADFMMEVASSVNISEGSSLIDSRRPTLTSITDISSRITRKASQHIAKDFNKASKPSFAHKFKKIISRQTKIMVREPLLTSARFIVHVIVGLSVSLLYGTEAGSSSGCNSLTRTGQPAFLDQKKIVYTNENMTLLFFTLFFLTFTSLTPTILTFPTELKIFMKEYHNNYYGTLVYFLATTIVDLPFQVIFPLVYVVIVYPMTCQPMEPYRFGLFSLISCLVSLVSQSVGLLISSVFSQSMKVIVFLAPVSLTPIFLFSGFFVRFSLSPSFLKPLYHSSYIKYSFEAFIHTIYGFAKCKAMDPYTFITAPLFSVDDSSNRTVFIGDEEGSGDSFEEYQPPLVVDAEDDYDEVNDTSSWTESMILNQTTEQLEKMEAVTEIISTTTMTVMDDPVMKKSAQYNGFDSVQFYSYVMKEFSLDDDHSEKEVLWSCVILLIMVIMLRFFSCLILVIKTRHHKKSRRRSISKS